MMGLPSSSGRHSTARMKCPFAQPLHATTRGPQPTLRDRDEVVSAK